MSSSNAQKIWLVTGASSGMGLAITLSALRTGYYVLAGARDPQKAAQMNPDVEKSGGKWFALDVTSTSAEQNVRNAIDGCGGRIDVLVNNAGYGLIGSIEDLSIEEIHAQMDTNFYGAVRIMKTIIPYMRTQKSGVIVNNTGVFGLSAAPGMAAYSASKYALEGMSESLALDLAPFGIRMVIFEAGVTWTNIFAGCQMPSNGLSKPYLESTVGAVANAFGYVAQHPEETIPGDAARLGDRVVEFVDGTGAAEGLTGYLRLLLGVDCVGRVRKALDVLGENVDAVEEVANSVTREGFEGAGEKGVMTIPLWNHSPPVA